MGKEKTLSKVELNSIDRYLIDKRLVHVDVRFETLDHIASDIEEQMNSEDLSFKKSFEISKRKWKPSLEISSSMWLGFLYRKPKIEIDRCIKVNKPILKKIFLFLFLTQTTAFCFNIKNFKLVFSAKWVNYPFAFLIILASGIITYCFVRIIQTRIKTSFSFIFYTQVTAIVMLNVFMCFLYFNFYKVPQKIDDLLILIALVNVLYGLISIKLYASHKKVLSIYKLI